VPTQNDIKIAQDALRLHLEDLFGPDLVGVQGFGAGLDNVTREMALKVIVDNQLNMKRASALPKTIQGLPVRISRRGIALFE
jgi:hypothetical protein